MGQPMHGPRVAITLARFLPDGLVSAVRDGPGEAVVASLEQTTETPELVWTPAMSSSLSAQLSTMAADLYQEQIKGRVVDWDVPEHASGQHVMKDEPQVHSDYFASTFCIMALFYLLASIYLGVQAHVLFPIICTKCSDQI
jgi:DnaJ homolog subfamily C member 13